MHTGYESSTHRRQKCTQKIKLQNNDDDDDDDNNNNNTVINLKNKNFIDCINIYLHCKLYNIRVKQ